MLLSIVASARKNCPNINIKLITSNEITDFIQHHKLNERFESQNESHYLSCSRHSISISHGASLLGTSASQNLQNCHVSIHFCSRKSNLLKFLSTSPLTISQQVQRTSKLETVSWSNSRQTSNSGSLSDLLITESRRHWK